MPPPNFTMYSGDHTQIIRPQKENPQNATPIDQLVFHRADGDAHPLELYPGMRPSQLRERVVNDGIIDFEKVRLHCDQAKLEQYKQLVQDAWPGKELKFTEDVPTEPGVHKVEGRITFKFEDRYFRVIAKIAFHYFLVHNCRGIRGDEPEYAPIRGFIINGGDPSVFFDAGGPKFAVPFDEHPSGEVRTPSQWRHVLAAHEESDVVVGYVYLFAGPGCVRKPHHIKLGPLNHRIVLSNGVFGHVYKYHKEQPEVGYAGQVIPASFTRIQ